MARGSPDTADGVSGRAAAQGAHPERVRVVLNACAFVLLWNSGFIGAEYVLPNVGPLSLLFWRYWALSLILGVYLGFRGRLVWPGREQAAHACLLGILAHGTWGFRQDWWPWLSRRNPSSRAPFPGS